MTMAHAAVAVLWNAAATSPFLVAAASRAWGRRLVWVVDRSDAGSAAFVPLLERSGTVVDASGKDEEQLAQELAQHEVGGLVALNDPPIQQGAVVADLLGLRFHSPRTAVMLTDKLEQRAALARAGVPSAAYAAIAPGDPVPTHVPLPAVLKPRSGASSRDVVLVSSLEELAAQLRLNAHQPMLLEEYLADPLDRAEHESGIVSVESVVVDGVIRHLGVTGRFPVAPPFRETGTYHPWEGPADEVAVLEDVAARAAEALGVRDGFLHTELKRTPDGPRVVEVNGRIGGQVPEMTTRAGGSDLVQQALRMSLGQPMETPRPLNGVAWLYLGQAPLGATEVVSIAGLDAVAELPDVTEVSLDRGPGAHVDAAEGTFGAVFSVAGHSPDHASMAATRLAILDLVTVETR